LPQSKISLVRESVCAIAVAYNNSILQAAKGTKGANKNKKKKKERSKLVGVDQSHSDGFIYLVVMKKGRKVFFAPETLFPAIALGDFVIVEVNYLLTHLLTYLLTYLLPYSLTLSLSYSLTYSFTYSLTLLLTSLLSYSLTSYLLTKSLNCLIDLL
jgi:hypothetical protein